MANRTCSIEGCTRAYRARGWCNTHYERWRLTGSAVASTPARGEATECRVPACRAPLCARGLCNRHYQNLTRYGGVIPMKERPLLDRVTAVGWSVTAGDCWEWLGRRNELGYGLYSHTRVHRITYEECVGPVPDGLIVRHKCDNPPCVNPRHLEVGTHKDNAADKVERGRHPTYSRTECPKGHDLTESGAIQTGTKRGCAQCDRDRKRRWEQKRRA